MTIWRDEGGALALAHARLLTGKPYVFGGTWPQSGGTDCSGLTQFAWGGVGVALARTTYVQYTEYQIPTTTPREVGDLIFIPGSDPIGDEPGHVMIYVAPGEVFEAPYTGVDIGPYPYDTSVASYLTRPSLALPVRPVNVEPGSQQPGSALLEACGLVKLVGAVESALAQRNGWTIFYFGVDRKFYPFIPNMPPTLQYTNTDYTQPRPKPH